MEKQDLCVCVCVCACSGWAWSLNRLIWQVSAPAPALCQQMREIRWWCRKVETDNTPWLTSELFVFLVLLVAEIPTAEWSQLPSSGKWFTPCKNKAWCKQPCFLWNEDCSSWTFKRLAVFYCSLGSPVSNPWTAFSGSILICSGLALKLSIRF